jgi:hypothetical protein
MGLPANIIGIMGKKQGYLPLTTAWIAATSESSTTILNALNTFEASLIANSMSSDLIAYYPMVGGSSTKHSYNFMNTSLYQLTFTGGWTHASTGALPNGTNAYANTGLNMDSVLTQNNTHVSFYSRTNAAAADRASIGGGNGSAPYLAIQTRIAAGFATAFNSSATLTQYVRVTNANSNGFYLNNKTSTAIGGLTLDRNGSQIGANTVIITTNNYQSSNLIISALTTTVQFDNKECAGVTVGLGLNLTKRGQLYTMIQALNTSLSRQV